MKPGFEKKFTDIQIGLIALSLEAVEDLAIEKVYAYGYIGEESSMFNVFFKSAGSIIPAHKLIQNNALMTELMEYGTDDLEKLRDLCAENETKCPVEMKMYYDCLAKKFSADYVYDVENPMEFSPHNSFLNWRNEVTSENQ